MENCATVRLINRIRALIGIGASKEDIRTRLISQHTDEEIFLAYVAAEMMDQDRE